MTNESWYYAVGREVLGPIPEQDLADRLHLRSLPPETLVWRDGMDQWLPADRCGAFREALATAISLDSTDNPSPAAAPRTEGGSESGKSSGTKVPRDSESPSSSGIAPVGPADPEKEIPDGAPPQPWDLTPKAVWQPSPPDPWRRYLARQVDVMLIQVALVTLLPAEHVPDPFTLKGAALGAGILFLWAILEGLFLSFLGFTPGKWLLGVMVTDRHGYRLRLTSAWRRAFDVVVRGLGLNVPVLLIVTQILSMQRLMQTGMTLWDRDGGFVVTHYPISPWRWMVLIGLLVLLLRETGAFEAFT